MDRRDYFYSNRKVESIKLEYCLQSCDTYDEFEKQYIDEFLCFVSGRLEGDLIFYAL